MVEPNEERSKSRNYVSASRAIEREEQKGYFAPGPDFYIGPFERKKSFQESLTYVLPANIRAYVTGSAAPDPILLSFNLSARERMKVVEMYLENHGFVIFERFHPKLR